MIALRELTSRVFLDPIVDQVTSRLEDFGFRSGSVTKDGIRKLQGGYDRRKAGWKCNGADLSDAYASKLDGQRHLFPFIIIIIYSFNSKEKNPTLLIYHYNSNTRMIYGCIIKQYTDQRLLTHHESSFLDHI